MGSEEDIQTTMNVSLPQSLREFAEERSAKGYSSTSEYVRELIRLDQRRSEQEKLESLLLEGLESGEPVVVTEDYWNDKRAALKAKHNK